MVIHQFSRQNGWCPSLIYWSATGLVSVVTLKRSRMYMIYDRRLAKIIAYPLNSPNNTAAAWITMYNDLIMFALICDMKCLLHEDNNVKLSRDRHCFIHGRADTSVFYFWLSPLIPPDVHWACEGKTSTDVKWLCWNASPDSVQRAVMIRWVWKSCGGGVHYLLVNMLGSEKNPDHR